jgi:outer membrane lipopolysaccharide assembly protein LptE/RlpB
LVKGLAVRKSILLLLMAISLLGGCGYHLTGTRENPSLIAGKSVAIPLWRSKSFRPFMESVLTQTLVEQFAMRSGSGVVSEEGADLVLTGSITNYKTEAVSYTASDKVREYRATMDIESELTEKRTQKVLWKGKLSSSQDYPASIDASVPNRIALQQNSEDAALREICRKLAEQLYLKVTENF